MGELYGRFALKQEYVIVYLSNWEHIYHFGEAVCRMNMKDVQTNRVPSLNHAHLSKRKTNRSGAT